MQQINNEDRIDITLNVCKELAHRLLDPTLVNGDKITLTPEERNEHRQDYYESLNSSMELLALFSEMENGFFNVLNIVTKYKLHVDPSKV